MADAKKKKTPPEKLARWNTCPNCGQEGTVEQGVCSSCRTTVGEPDDGGGDEE